MGKDRIAASTGLQGVGGEGGGRGGGGAGSRTSCSVGGPIVYDHWKQEGGGGGGGLSRYFFLGRE